MDTSQEGHDTRLGDFCERYLSGRQVILASNRGPVEYYLTEDGRVRSRPGSGGLVTALSGLGRHVELNWIASAMGRGDREVAQRAQGKRFRVKIRDYSIYLRFVFSSRDTYHKYYSVICNPLLWFIQHYMWNSPSTPNIDISVHDAWERGYVEVNQAFARAIADEAIKGHSTPIVIINDYHLYLAATYLRQHIPDLIIEHFTHIPWPAACYWRLLPSYMRQAIFRGLCAADIVGLQTSIDVHNFIHCCQSCIKEAEVDYSQSTVRIDGHVTRVKAYPISIDTAGIRKLASSSRLRDYEKKLSGLCAEHTIVRVDRAEPSKNIIRGFKAFDRLLERHPQLRGRVKFIAFLVPTRTHLRPYRRYMEETIQLIKAINCRYATGEWYPIDFFYENNYVQALAGMRLYDVLLVNAVVDGMNLVAKEGPTVNNRDGVLVLSESVGACEQLGDYALTVAPSDLEGTMEALYSAIIMPEEEKKRRARALKKSIDKDDINNWLMCLLEDAAGLIEEVSRSST